MGKACCLHLGHDVGPVDFDSPGADAEVVGNDLVGSARDKAIQNLPFAGGEARQSFLNLGSFSISLCIRILCTERGPHGFEQDLAVVRLFDEIQGTSFDRLYGKGNITMAGDDDHRQANPVDS